MDSQPKKPKIMTTGALQLKTLELIRRVRVHIETPKDYSGPTDEQFLEEVVKPLEDQIRQDRVDVSEYAKLRKAWRDQRAAED